MFKDTLQVTSLELSKRLKELGVKQESLWMYNLGGHLILTNGDGAEEHITDMPQCWCNPKVEVQPNGSMVTIHNNDAYISAFTVSELGEMLWKAGSKNFIKAYGEVFDFKGTEMVGLLGVMNLIRNPNMSAKMLIYLLENNLLKC